MLFILSFLMAGKLDGAVWTFESDFPQPFFLEARERLIDVSDRGETFFIDTLNPRMTRVDGSGKVVSVIANQGQGPGEMIQPTHLEIHGDRVFVKDTGKNCISIWKTDGSFVQQIKTKGRNFGMSLCTVRDGFVLADWDFSNNPQKPIQALFYSTTTDSRTVLWETERLTATGGSVARMGKSPRVQFNPAKDNYFLASTKSGDTLFISEPGDKLKIHVVDVGSGKKINTITEPLNRIPFNTDWGNNQLRLWKEYTDSLSDAPQGVKVETDFTENFPLVRGFFVAADDNLVVSLWTGLPDTRQAYLVFNARGEKTESALTDPALNRVLALIGDNAYVTTYNKEKEVSGFAVVPRDGVDPFIESNPIEYDGHLPYDIYLVR